MTDRNFILALENINQACNVWKKSSVDFEAIA
jgi:hypothetical protein